MPPRFKLTDESYAPANLPAALARRGYSPTAPTLVMIAAVAGATPPPGVAVSAAMQREFDAVLRAVSKNQAEYDERVSIALRAPAPAAFAMIERQGRVAAIGMCASTEAFAGLFLMRTAPDARRQGLARLVLRSLLARAASWGAETAFLQVEADNGPGFALYASEGFTPLTRYSFWRKTQP